jgi:hypothetical protein
VTPGWEGTITSGICSSRARSTAWSGACAAEGDEAELAGVEPALDRDEADCLDHVRIGDPQHAFRSVLDAQSERLRDPRLDRLARLLEVEPHAALQEDVVRDPP